MSEKLETIGVVAARAGAVIGVLAFAATLGLLLAFPIKWTWNATMPYMFALPTITWGKAWCLHFFVSCLIKSASTTTKK